MRRGVRPLRPFALYVPRPQVREQQPGEEGLPTEGSVLECVFLCETVETVTKSGEQWPETCKNQLLGEGHYPFLKL